MSWRFTTCALAAQGQNLPKSELRNAFIARFRWQKVSREEWLNSTQEAYRTAQSRVGEAIEAIDPQE